MKSKFIDLYREMYDAMVSKNCGKLKNILAKDFQLTHMTGIKQNKEEWLKQIENGMMCYQESIEEGISFLTEYFPYKLVGKNRVKAKIYGSEGEWSLQLTLSYKKVKSKWFISSVVATTY